MIKTTAKVVYRSHVPFGWIAIPFCRVEFYGPLKKEMEETWKSIENLEIKQYKRSVQERVNKAESIYKQIKSNKPFWRFWYNRNEKNMIQQADKLLIEAARIEDEVLNGQSFGSIYKYRHELENFFQRYGFVLTHTSSAGTECITHTEIWTCEKD